MASLIKVSRDFGSDGDMCATAMETMDGGNCKVSVECNDGIKNEYNGMGSQPFSTTLVPVLISSRTGTSATSAADNTLPTTASVPSASLFLKRTVKVKV